MLRVTSSIVLLFFVVFAFASEPPEEKDKGIEPKPKIQLDPIIRKALLRALSELESNDTIITDTEVASEQNEEPSNNQDDNENQTPIKYHSFVIDGQKVFTDNNTKISAISSNEIDNGSSTKKTLSSDAYIDEIIETNESTNFQQSRSIVNSISSNSAKISNLKSSDSTTTKKPNTPTTTTTTTTTTPKPTHNEDGENIEEVSNRDVQVFQAPLVAAFTVQQDEQGLPKKVIPIVKLPQFNENFPSPISNNKNDFLSQQFNLQKQLEEKQRLLEQQLKLLQDQQKQQEEFLRRQQEELSRNPQQVQNQIPFKPLPQTLIQTTSFEDQRRQQNTPNLSQGSLVSIQQSRNVFPLQQNFNQQNQNIQSFNSNGNQVQSQFNGNQFQQEKLPVQREIQNNQFQRHQQNQQQSQLNQQQLPNNQQQQPAFHQNQLPLQHTQSFQQNQLPRHQNQQQFQQNQLNHPNQVQQNQFQRDYQLNSFQQLPTRNQSPFINQIQPPQQAQFPNQFEQSRQPQNLNQFNQFTPQQNSNNRGTVITVQPSVSLEASNNIINQQLPSREAVDFLLQLRNQRPTQFPLQDNHLPVGIGRLPLPASVQNFIPAENVRPLNSVNSNINSGPQNVRVFRQESGSGNLGFNDNRINNNFSFGNQRQHNFQQRFPQSRNQGFRITPDEELQKLLFQSGVTNTPPEDLNIVSKVLALNHGFPERNFDVNRRPVRNFS